MARGAGAAEIIDVGAWIDIRRLSRVQMLVFVLCFIMSAVEGFDAQVIGFVAPALIRAFAAQKQQMGVVFAAGLFGLLLGCLFVAPLADWIGRKRILVGSAVAFGVMSLLTTQAHSITALLWLQFATGLGLGGAMANGIALTAEYLPARRRAALTMAMFTGFPFGATVGGFLAARLIPAYGWQSVFVVGGVAPLVFALILVFELPESIRFLAVDPKRATRIRKILLRIDPSAAFPTEARFMVPEEKARGLTVFHLFRDGRALGSLLLWVVFFMSLLDIYFISSWLPTILNDAGFSIQSAVIATAVVQAGGVVGALAMGPVVDRFGFRVVLPLLYIVAAVAIALLGRGGASAPLIMIAAFVSGFGVIGGQTAANVLAAIFYPTAARATGVGWALGIGRIGSIVGPLIGGLLLQLRWTNESLFVAAAAPAVLACLAAIGLALQYRSRIDAPAGQDHPTRALVS